MSRNVVNHVRVTGAENLKTSFTFNPVKRTNDHANKPKDAMRGESNYLAFVVKFKDA
jgi:hypothetical protein